MLWPESSTAQSRKYLRQSLWHLRALGAEGESGQLLSDQSEWIQIDDSRVWLDVAELEAAFAPVKLVPGEDIGEDRAAALKEAVPLYRGDLLEGCYQDWCVYERERLKAMHVSMLEKLLGYCEAHAEPEEGLGYGEALLRHDRAHERAHWRLMRLHYLAGDRTAALRQFEQCRIALQEELGTVPGGRIRTLYEQIRADTGITALRPGPGRAAPAGPERDDLVPVVAEPLEQALGALALTCRLLEEGLQTLRRVRAAPPSAHPPEL